MYSTFAASGVVMAREDRTFGQDDTPVTDLVIQFRSGTRRDGQPFSMCLQVSCLREAHDMAAGVRTGDLVAVSGELVSRQRQRSDGSGTWWSTNVDARSVVVLPRPQGAPQAAPQAHRAPQPAYAPQAAPAPSQAYAPAPQAPQPPAQTQLYDADIPF